MSPFSIITHTQIASRERFNLRNIWGWTFEIKFQWLSWGPILENTSSSFHKSQKWKSCDARLCIGEALAKIAWCVTRTSFLLRGARKKERKKQKQLRSVSSLCVPCNNSLLNPRCPSVRPYGTTTRRFKTKHYMRYTTQTQWLISHTYTHTRIHTQREDAPPASSHARTFSLSDTDTHTRA